MEQGQSGSDEHWSPNLDDQGTRTFPGQLKIFPNPTYEVLKLHTDKTNTTSS